MLRPLLLGFALGWFYLPVSEYKFAQSLFLGTALAITAVPVSVKILMDLGLLKTRLGQTIVSAALFDAILSLILLAVLTAVIKTGEVHHTASAYLTFVAITDDGAAREVPPLLLETEEERRRHMEAEKRRSMRSQEQENP